MTFRKALILMPLITIYHSQTKINIISLRLMWMIKIHKVENKISRTLVKRI